MYENEWYHIARLKPFRTAAAYSLLCLAWVYQVYHTELAIYSRVVLMVLMLRLILVPLHRVKFVLHLDSAAAVCFVWLYISMVCACMVRVY